MDEKKKKKTPGHPPTTPEIRNTRKRKIDIVLEWLTAQKNITVQEYMRWWAVAVKSSAPAPELYLLCPVDIWQWFDRAAKKMNEDGITFGEGLRKSFPLTRPVRSEQVLQRKLDQLKGMANGNSGTDGETEGQREEGVAGSGVA